MDDDLCVILVNPLGPGVRLHAIIDACHSGSMLDLEERAKMKNGVAHWKQGAWCCFVCYICCTSDSLVCRSLRGQLQALSRSLACCSLLTVLCLRCKLLCRIQASAKAVQGARCPCCVHD